MVVIAIVDVLNPEPLYPPINDQQFSTNDRDNDILDRNPTSCAVKYAGGWWFSHCHNILLTGDYDLPVNGESFWSRPTGELKSAIMMIR